MAKNITIKHYHSETANQKPTASSLDYGEIAINHRDKKIYIKDTNNSVVAIGDDIPRVTIVSSTGASESSVMSQKAVTDALSLKANASSLGSYATLSDLNGYAKTADVTKTLTIQRNSVTVDTYDGTATKTINISVPSAVSLNSSTGTSTTAGMTQKAITDALSNKANSSSLSSYITSDDVPVDNGTGSYSMVLKNRSNSATGNTSMALGYNNKTYGNFSSIIAGSGNTNSGLASTIIGGANNTVSTSIMHSIVGGESSTVSGHDSISFGRSCQTVNAEGSSCAVGHYCIANSYGSFALGGCNGTSNWGEFGVGRLGISRKEYNTSSSFSTKGTLFYVGNGAYSTTTGDKHHNCFEILQDGRIMINNIYQGGGNGSDSNLICLQELLNSAGLLNSSTTTATMYSGTTTNVSSSSVTEPNTSTRYKTITQTLNTTSPMVSNYR